MAGGLLKKNVFVKWSQELGSGEIYFMYLLNKELMPELSTEKINSFV